MDDARLPGATQEHVEALVRKADPDRYLATLYAPRDKRRGIFALCAFNAEIASVRERIRQPMTGEVRLQWWRDALFSGGEGENSASPILAELMWAIRTHGLPLAAFENYLEARVFDLYDDPMPSRADLEGYCGETASAVIQMAALILDPLAATKVATASGHAGCAYAIAGILRSAPQHRARGQCYVPADILAAVGSTPRMWIEDKDRQATARVTQAMASLGRQHYSEFALAIGNAPEAIRPAFLPVALVPAYLDKIERGDPSWPADISTLRRHWTLFRHARSGWRSS